MMTGYRRSTEAEWHRLARRRPTMRAVVGASALATLLTWAVLATAEAGSAPGSSVGALQASDGLVLPGSLAASYLFMLLLATFAAMAAGGYARGTTRAALLRQPGRLALFAGELTARLAYVVLVLVAALLVTIGVSFALAPAYGIDTSAWLSADGLAAVAETAGRLALFAAGWALLGSLLGVLTRSVVAALGIGLLWAGPFENIVGDQIDAGPRFFPGLLLRGELTPSSTSVDQVQVFATLGLYAVLALVVTAVVVRRRDVTT